MPRAEYVKLAQQWNPARFNPEVWLDLLQEAGMQYLCITTKHHDGFCLWDTKQTPFNTMNTPYRRDIIGMLAEACHKQCTPCRVGTAKAAKLMESPKWDAALLEELSQAMADASICAWGRRRPIRYGAF